MPWNHIGNEWQEDHSNPMCKSPLKVSIQHLYSKFNIILVLIVVTYSLRLHIFDILWLSLRLDPIDIIRWGCACIIILSMTMRWGFKGKRM